MWSKLVLTLLFFSHIGFSEENITQVRVIKSEHKLQLLSHEKIVDQFHVVFGANSKGHKTQEGDEKTPEGKYTLDYKKADSAFYKAMHISYPNAEDSLNAKKRDISPGGQIMIHGQKNGLSWLTALNQKFNWTNGCIALANEDMEKVWLKVKVGTPIEILP